MREHNVTTATHTNSEEFAMFSEISPLAYFNQSLSDLAINYGEKITKLNFNKFKLSSDHILDIADAFDQAAKHGKLAYVTSINLSQTQLGKIEPELLKDSLEILAIAIKNYFVLPIPETQKPLIEINLAHNELTGESLGKLFDCIQALNDIPGISKIFLDLSHNLLDNVTGLKLLSLVYINKKVVCDIKKNKIAKPIKESLKKHIKENKELTKHGTNLHKLQADKFELREKLSDLIASCNIKLEKKYNNTASITVTSKQGRIEGISIESNAFKKDLETLGNLIKAAVNKVLRVKATRPEETKKLQKARSSKNLNNNTKETTAQPTNSSKKGASLTSFAFTDLGVAPKVSNATKEKPKSSKRHSSTIPFTLDIPRIFLTITANKGTLRIIFIENLIYKIRITSKDDVTALENSLVSAINKVTGKLEITRCNSGNTIELNGDASSGQSGSKLSPNSTPPIRMVTSETFLPKTKSNDQKKSNNNLNSTGLNSKPSFGQSSSGSKLFSNSTPPIRMEIIPETLLSNTKPDDDQQKLSNDSTNDSQSGIKLN